MVYAAADGQRQPAGLSNYYRRERSDIAKYPTGLVSYRFPDEIHATLVVRTASH